MSDCPFGDDQYQFGKTKVFIRTPESLFALEDNRVNYYHNMVRGVSLGHGHVCRVYLRFLSRCFQVSRIKNAYRNHKAFKHECSNRIKSAYLCFKAFKQQCAKIIQQCFRDYKVIPLAVILTSVVKASYAS